MSNHTELSAPSISEQYSSSGVRKASKWTLNESACTIRESYKFKHVFAFNICVERCLNPGAFCMQDFADTDTGKMMQKLYLLFIEFGKRCWEAFRFFCDIMQKKTNGCWLAPPCPVIFFAEAVLKDQKKVQSHSIKQNKKVSIQYAAPDAAFEMENVIEFTDITFYICVVDLNLSEEVKQLLQNANENNLVQRNSKTDVSVLKLPSPNVIWADLINEIIQLNEQLGEEAKGSKLVQRMRDLKSHEKHLTLKSKNDLIDAYDTYVGQKQASMFAIQIANTPLESNRNILSATAFFHPLYTLVQSRSKFSIDAQSPIFFHQYQFTVRVHTVTNEDEKLTWTLRFPVRTFVFTISTLDMERTKMVDIELPWNQINDNEKVQAGLAKVLAEYNELSESLNIPQMNITESNGKGSTEIEIDQNGLDFDKKSIDLAKQSMKSILETLQINFALNDKESTFTLTPDINTVNTLQTENYFSPHITKFVNCYTPIEAYSQLCEKSISTLIARLSSKKSSNEIENNVKSPIVIATKLRRMQQTFGLKQFCETCRSEFSDLSPYIQLYYANGLKKLKLYSKAATISHKKKDPELSTMANYELMQYSAHLFFGMNSIPKIRQLLEQFRHSVHYSKLNEIRLNLILCSLEGATGKSYQLHQLKEYSIPGTVVFETYRSDKANAVMARDIGGSVVCMEEMDLSLLVEPKNSNNVKDTERPRQMKEIITSNELHFRVLKMDANGNRTSIVHSVICPTVFFGASNHPLRDMMSPAAYSRWQLCFTDLEGQGDADRVQQYKAYEDMSTNQQMSKKDDIILESQVLQLMMMELEKLIQCRIIEAPTLDAANLFMILFIKELKKSGIDMAKTRDVVRTILLARIKCMIDAIQSTFFFPGGKHYGKEIQPWHFLDLEPLLFVTTQHIVSAIGEQIDLFYDSYESQVLNFFRLEWAYRRTHKTDWTFLRSGDSHTKQIIYNYNYATWEYTTKDFNEFFDKYTKHVTSAINLKDQGYFPLIWKEMPPAFKKCADMSLKEIPSKAIIINTMKEWSKRRHLASMYSKERTLPCVIPTVDPVLKPILIDQQNANICISYDFLMYGNENSHNEMWHRSTKIGEHTIVQKDLTLELNHSTLVDREGVEIAPARKISSQQLPGSRNRHGQRQFSTNSNEKVKTFTNIVENKIFDILSRRGQVAQTLLFDVNKACNHIRNVITIAEEDIRDDIAIIIPNPTAMDAISRKVLSDDSDNVFEDVQCSIVMDIPLDSWAHQKRNKVLGIVPEFVTSEYRRMNLFTDMFQFQQAAIDQTSTTSNANPETKVEYEIVNDASNTKTKKSNKKMNKSNSISNSTDANKELNQKKEHFERLKKSYDLIPMLKNELCYDQLRKPFFMGKPLDLASGASKTNILRNLTSKLKTIYSFLDTEFTVKELTDDEFFEKVVKSQDSTKVEQYKKYRKQLYNLNYHPEKRDFTLIDIQFNPEDYIVEEATETTSPVYHWQSQNIPQSLKNNAMAYKVMANHPMIREMFVNEKFYQKTNGGWYPKEELKKVIEQRTKVDDLINRASRDKQVLHDSLKAKTLTLATNLLSDSTTMSNIYLEMRSLSSQKRKRDDSSQQSQSNMTPQEQFDVSKRHRTYDSSDLHSQDLPNSPPSFIELEMDCNGNVQTKHLNNDLCSTIDIREKTHHVSQSPFSEIVDQPISSASSPPAQSPHSKDQTSDLPKLSMSQQFQQSQSILPSQENTENDS